MKKNTSFDISSSSHLKSVQPNEAKRAAGYAAAELIPSGSCIGLGTGSTVAYFLEALAIRCRKGLQITAVSTSEATAARAQDHHIPLINIAEVSFLDMTVDGADEVDPEKQMIKGGGGALLREKILASHSKEMIVIIDSGKCVKKLGRHKLPIEIVPFGAEATLAQLEQMGYFGKWRCHEDGTHFMTDNGNRIADLDIEECKETPREMNTRIRNTVGVIETGFFFDLAGRVIVGFADGHVEIRP